ncbi:hypothetical protein QBZ16_000295 [Prototheca wickerhamii]|uniref:G-patch domain-containing protein n=1 Tax=Prototheca wickerhamii TaxID=3111 RepID=A0AAD9IPR8_PROWI|nr:hypothetical protein QBZ16_000295 [Prototheca wickerhamii]
MGLGGAAAGTGAYGASTKARRSKPAPVTASAQSVGGFEAFTKGIGSKLLAKMGWEEGRGLGRDGSGIARPLEAQMRPKGMGMGFGDRPEPKLLRPDAVPEAAAEEDEAEADGSAALDGARARKAPPRQQASQRAAWRQADAARRERRQFRTAEDLLAVREDRAPAPLSIIDMRGAAGPRVLTDLAEVAEAPGAEDAAARDPLPELRHNLGLLVARAEEAVRRAGARRRRETESVALHRAELERLAPELASARRSAAGLAAARDACERGERTASAAGLAALYAELQAREPEAYAAHGAARPLLRALRDWDPLAAPERGAEALRPWRALLRAGRDEGAWARLLEQALLPPLRRAVVNRWDLRDPEPLERFLAAWEPLLPPALLRDQVLAGLVLPRLERALEAWDPLTDPTLLHLWVHPWLPHLGEALQARWPGVRQRLAAALRAWHPADASALEMLAPWARVWGEREWAAFLRRAVAPRLAAALEAMPVDPGAQDLAPWDWAMAWRGLAPAGLLADVLDRAFWPRWHAVLAFWLGGAPDTDEVAAWIQGWRALLGEDLLAEPRVRAHLSRATDALNLALAGRRDEAVRAAAGELIREEGGKSAQRGADSAQSAPTSPNPPIPVPFTSKVTLRALLEEHAAERGVVFVPRRGRSHEGLPVFAYGAVTCAVDAKAGLLRALLPDRGWVPLSIEALDAENDRRAEAKGRA